MRNNVHRLLIACWLVLFITGSTGLFNIYGQKVPVIPAGDFLAVSDEMKAFLDTHIMKVKDRRERLQVLIKAIFDRSLLNFEYTNIKTRTAADTFKNRSGNCLSYTAMFIVMARYVNLPAYFQEVYDYSNWTRRSGTVVFNRHIDAVVLIEGKRIDVDFDASSDKKLRRSRQVSDRRAYAHFYNNLGAEALLAKDFSHAEALFKEAIRQDEKFSATWSNLGLLYSSSGKNEQAEALYKKAIKLDKNDISAWVNLATLYEREKRTAEAAKIRKTIRKVNNKNPFYHYNLGQQAFEAEDYRQAVKHFKMAVRRSSKEAAFYAKLAAAYYKLGDRKGAAKNLRKAEKLAKSANQRRLYSWKLNWLDANR
jgi:Flp pilus assembly protein TadD